MTSSSSQHKSDQKASQSWTEAAKVYFTRPAITMFFLGYSSGLPILLVFGSLSVWLAQAGISRASIGFISWVALAYGLKFTWAPLIDAVKLPILHSILGRRRSWLFVTQIFVILAICGMAFNDAAIDPGYTALLAGLLAFSGATQDAVIDAYRIERADESYQAAMAATYQAGYRIAMILASAGALYIAGFLGSNENTYIYEGWKAAYLTMAAAMGIGLLTTFFIREPEKPAEQAKDPWLASIDEQIAKNKNLVWRPFIWIFHKFIWPIVDFVQRYRLQAIVILALIATYRISDIVMGVMSNVFYTEMGYSLIEIANISKTFGVIISLIGAFCGGLLVRRFGMMPILLLGAVLSSASNLLFAYMASLHSSDLIVLAIIISADNLSAGIASSAFIAYLSSLVNKQFSASQYALYSSIMVILPKFIGGFSGVIVDASNWTSFFIFTALIGLPVIFLIFWISRLQKIK